MQSVLADIINRLETEQFPNEQAIKQGVVLRLLSILGWDIYDPKTVWPEFSVNGGHVDFALCNPIDRPRIFIEVKQSSTFNIGEDQLMMRYAFQHGVPIAVLTDGQRWSFYLPRGDGSFEERRFYLLDLLERDAEEIELRLRRYLDFSEVKTNRAFEAARFDHDDAARRRAIAGALPVAWKEMIRDADPRLIQALLAKVESSTGYQPQEAEAEIFLKQQALPEQKAALKVVKTSRQNIGKPQTQKSLAPVVKVESSEKQSELPNWYSLNDGAKQGSLKAIETTVNGLKELIAQVPDFMASFERESAEFRKKKKSKGAKRRWVAQNREDLYQNPKLIQASREIAPNWWLGTNYGNADKRDMLTIAKKIAARSNIKFDFELE